MTNLEYRILKYIEEQCDMGWCPKHHDIRSRFHPEVTSHAVNALWARGYLSRSAYSRRYAHRGFIITEQGRMAVRPKMIG